MDTKTPEPFLRTYILTTPKGPREFTDLKELIAYQDSLWSIRTTPVIRWTDANGVSHKLAVGDRGEWSSSRLKKRIQEKESKG